MRTSPPAVLLLAAAAAASYIPPYYEGTPEFVGVAGLDPPDYRGEEAYRLEFTLIAERNMPHQGFVHRSWADFQQFDHLLTTHLLNFGLDFPEEPSVENLDSYLQRVMTHSGIVSNNIFHDFLGINWSGRDLTFLQNLPGFMKVVIPPLYRAPHFPPEPPVFDSELDAITAEETPFEVWVYLMAFRSSTNLQEYLQFFNSYLNTNPDFSGPEDDADVLPDGVSIDYPEHFNKTFVHFLPQGYLNGHTTRISFLGKSKFNFLNETRIEEWVRDLHGDKKPKRILDIGTGPGFSAYTFARVFPEAEVIGVDMAPPYIRFAKRWNEVRNVSNVQFYAANAEDLSWLESESFDIINYAYVLHEMPAVSALNIISEMYRLLRPGGTMNGFEVPYSDYGWGNDVAVIFNTWGHDWQDGSSSPQGPEPYCGEYINGVALPESLAAAGFRGINQIEYTFFDSVFLAYKQTVPFTPAPGPGRS